MVVPPPCIVVEVALTKTFAEFKNAFDVIPTAPPSIRVTTLLTETFAAFTETLDVTLAKLPVILK